MVRTDQTLLEQMKISDVDISSRMSVLGLNKADLEILYSNQALVVNQIDGIVEEFYQRQTENDEISLLIGDADTLQRLRSAQRKYVLDLFSGIYDGQYVNNRLRIGMIHKRIGVEPKLYLSAVRTLKEIIINTLIAHIQSPDCLSKTLDALDKLIYFDTTLVFDAYIDSLVGEIKSAKAKSEEYATSLEDKVAERTHQLEALAKTDPLTGLYNQRAMYEMLRRDIAVAKRRKTTLSFVYFDVDKFKEINDKLGHIEGDNVLKFIGQSLLGIIREVDVSCRYGGDEFALILPECNTENAVKLCEKMITVFNGKYPDFSLSIGIAEIEADHDNDAEQLIKLADKKMYLSKKEAGSYITS